MMHRIVTLFLVILAAEAPTFGQSPASRPAQQIPVVKLTLHCVAATQPALRYPLLPNVIDQAPGDAAPLYLLAGRSLPVITEAAPDDLAASGEWFHEPLPEFLSHEALIQKSLDEHETMFHLIDSAARCERTTWGGTLRQDGIAALLPYLNDMRRMVRVTALKARFQVAKKDWNGACRTLQDGLWMTWRLNDHAVLIQAMVESGSAYLFMEVIDDWVSQSDAPNLYWSLTALPSPFVDLRAVQQWERAFLYFTFPELEHADILSPEECKHVMAKLKELEGGPHTSIIDMGEQAMASAAIYPTAKQFLISTGQPKEKVDALTVDQVVLSYYLQQWHMASDEVWKAWTLPYWQGAPILERSVAQIHENMAATMFSILMPALQKVRLQFAATDRSIALLRTVEALRDYAAKHDGRPPLSLDQIVDTPVPLDPVTGKSFIYHADANNAVLEAPIPQGGGAYLARRYELTFVK